MHQTNTNLVSLQQPLLSVLTSPMAITCSEAAARRCSQKKLFSKFSQENTCARVSLAKKTRAQVFSWEFCKISKNTFFYRTPPVAASACSTKTVFYKNTVQQRFWCHATSGCFLWFLWHWIQKSHSFLLISSTFWDIWYA